MRRQLFTRLYSSRLLRGIGANVYGQLAQVAVQIISVPVLVTHWGLSTYGAWLMLFTVPSYLALADLGFASAAANDMTASVAKGDRSGALATFQAVRVAVLAIGLMLWAFCAAILYGPLPHLISGADAATHGHARSVVLVLIAYGLMALQNTVSLAGFRAIGGYALGTALQASILLAETLGALITVSLGGDIGACALSYLLVRFFGGVVLAIVLAWRAPWLMTTRWRSSLGHLKVLFAPAAAVMALPAAQVVFLQGTVLVVGLAAGPVAVPAFTAVRTLSRVAVQVTSIINHAVMPAFTMAVAQGNPTQKARLAALSTFTSVGVLILLFPIIMFGGQAIVRLWTHGAVHPRFALVFMMALVMLVNGVWHPLSNLILATNRHAQYSYYYLTLALVAVLVSYPLTRIMGSPGAAAAILALDIFMFLRVWQIAPKLGIISVGDLRGSAYEIWRVSMDRRLFRQNQRVATGSNLVKRADAK